LCICPLCYGSGTGRIVRKRGGHSGRLHTQPSTLTLFSCALAGQSVTPYTEDIMCHNHSHLIATFLGEDTSNSLPVLTHQLANDLLRVESPQRDGGLLTLKTSGLLRVPSMMLGGYFQSHLPQTEVASMSLFFLPEGATTTILKASWDWMNASERFHPLWVDSAPPRLHTLKNEAVPDDVPW
jgi:hypothetical protein